MSTTRSHQAAVVSCTGKEPMSFAIAQKVSGKLRSGATSAYHCEHCGAFHVGSHLKKTVKRKKKLPRKEPR